MRSCIAYGSAAILFEAESCPDLPLFLDAERFYPLVSEPLFNQRSIPFLLIFGLIDLVPLNIGWFIGLGTDWLLGLRLCRLCDLDFDLDFVNLPLLLLLCFEAVLPGRLQYGLIVADWVLFAVFDSFRTSGSTETRPRLAFVCRTISAYYLPGAGMSLAISCVLKCLFSEISSSLSFFTALSEVSMMASAFCIISF